MSIISESGQKFRREDDTILNDNAPVLKNPPNSRLRVKYKAQQQETPLRIAHCMKTWIKMCTH